MSGFFYANNSTLSDRIEPGNSLTRAHQAMASTLVDKQTKPAACIEILWFEFDVTDVNKALSKLFIGSLICNLSGMKHFASLHVSSGK